MFAMRRVLGGMMSVAVCVGCDGSGASLPRVGETSMTCTEALLATEGRVYSSGGVVDVADPASPAVLAGALPLPALADGATIWTVEGRIVSEIDASEVAAPVTVRTFDLGIAVDEWTALAVTDAAIAVLDLGNGGGLYVLDRDAPEQDGVAVLAGWAGVPATPSTIRARGDLVVIAGTAGAVVYDLSDPYRPRRAGELRAELDGGRIPDHFQWAGFHGDRVVAVNSGNVVVAPVAEDGAVGELSALLSDRDQNDLGTGIVAAAGDVFVTRGSGAYEPSVYRIGDDDVRREGFLPGFCAAAGHGDHLYFSHFGDRFEVVDAR
jgi:hypothetical protein